MLKDMTLKDFLKDCCITVTLLIIATFFAFSFHIATKNSPNIGIIYMLAIVLIARLTSGYWFGVIASLVGVVCVLLAIQLLF